MAIVIDMDACYGCRTCQLACGSHHTGEFDPDKSSIRVNRDYRTGVVTLAIDPAYDAYRARKSASL
jgi:Fe-S-cluster-containing dehydrogenase component